MAVSGFLVTSDLTALPGSGHTATIGAQLGVPPGIYFRLQHTHPCHACFLSTVQDAPDITSPVALILHLLSVQVSHFHYSQPKTPS